MESHLPLSLMALESSLCRCLSHRGVSKPQRLSFVMTAAEGVLNLQLENSPCRCQLAHPTPFSSGSFCIYSSIVLFLFMAACFSAGSSVISEATDSAFFSSSQGSRQNKPIEAEPDTRYSSPYVDFHTSLGWLCLIIWFCLHQFCLCECMPVCVCARVAFLFVLVGRDSDLNRGKCGWHFSCRCHFKNSECYNLPISTLREGRWREDISVCSGMSLVTGLTREEHQRLWFLWALHPTCLWSLGGGFLKDAFAYQ